MLEQMDPKLEDNRAFEDITLRMDPKLEGTTELSSLPPLDEGFKAQQPTLSNAEKDLLLDDHGRAIPPWHQQVTIRALVVGAGISTLFCIMVLKCVLVTVSKLTCFDLLSSLHLS